MNKRLLRGGSWGSKPGKVRSANRLKGRLAFRSSDVGFRIAGPKTEPKFRALRGGSWVSKPGRVRAATRNWRWPTFCYYFVGFRITRNAK